MAFFTNERHLRLQVQFFWAKYRRYFQKPSIPISFLVFLLFFLWIWRINQVPKDLIQLYETLRQKNANGTLGACRLPKFDPFDPSILRYISTPDPLICKKLQPNLTFLDLNGFLHINEQEVDKAGLRSDLRCQFREFSHNCGVDDDSVKFGQWGPLEIGEKALVTTDFVEVRCLRGKMNLNVYNYHFAQVVPKSESLVFPAQNPSKKSIKFRKTTPDDKFPKLNVVIVGIDSMSKSNMIRQLPKTYDYLTNRMSATVFDGHVKMGDNTYLNMMAFLIGKRVWPTEEFPSEIKDSLYMFYDNWTRYIWDDFTEQGYATFFEEDRPDISLFNYKGYLYGFKFQPVTHYVRPYWFEVWWNTLHRRSSAFCYDQVAEHKIQLDYLEQFVRKYAGRRNWSLFWHNALSHDLLNKIGVADEDFLGFFSRSHKFVNDSIFIVISDHGHRYHSIRESVVGRLEARMPFFAMVLPPWFKNRFPQAAKNLQSNSQRLTTMFDIYETLLEISQGTYGSVPSEEPKEEKRAYSLFRPIPLTRQCYGASIPDEYCPCYEEVSLDPGTSFEAQKAALSLLIHVNSLLEKEGTKCAKYSLSEIKDASTYLPNKRTMKDPQTGGKIPIRGFHVKYRITIVVDPNKAQLEAVIRRSFDSQGYTVEGDIERNNKYGNTSSCVTDRLMQKICYCV